MLTEQQVDQFRRTGHLTVENVFSEREIDDAITDIRRWSDEFLNSMSADDRRWYLEQASGDVVAIRKLDNPVFHRDVFRAMAAKSELVAIVQQLIGQGVSLFFSQVFMKPPEVGGAKPIHQDNYYFGPDDLDAMVTVWIALDEATTKNGCLHYSDLHQSSVFEHLAPDGEPFNLQISPENASEFAMVAAPVPSGGISLHHGNTLHQSSNNLSQDPRRAAAFHYLRNDAKLIRPALAYDDSVNVRITP